MVPCWQVLRFLPGEGVRLYGLTLFSAGIRLSGPIQLLGIPTRGFHPRAVLPSFNGESTGRPHSSSPASASPSSFSSSATSAVAWSGRLPSARMPHRKQACDHTAPLAWHRAPDGIHSVRPHRATQPAFEPSPHTSKPVPGHSAGCHRQIVSGRCEDWEHSPPQHRQPRFSRRPAPVDNRHLSADGTDARKVSKARPDVEKDVFDSYLGSFCQREGGVMGESVHVSQ